MNYSSIIDKMTIAYSTKKNFKKRENKVNSDPFDKVELKAQATHLVKRSIKMTIFDKKKD